MVDDALARGGTCSGEHGIGEGKIGALEQEHGDLIPLLVGIKQVFDPLGIMNPGKVLRDVPYTPPGPLAQLVEQGTFNPKVAGSIPARPIINTPLIRDDRSDLLSVCEDRSAVSLGGRACGVRRVLWVFVVVGGGAGVVG